MCSRQEVTEKIKSAILQSCDDALCFSDDETHLIDAEYLLTINAAKSIQTLNVGFAYPYKISLECDTDVVSTACVPLFGKNSENGSMAKKLVVRKKLDTRRIGKVDIAVFNRKANDATLCAIELKGFNPGKKLVVDDLRRNAEYFSKRSNTGNSLISFTVFATLHSYRNSMSEKKKSANIEKIKKRYENYLESVKLAQGVNHEIDVFTIRGGTAPYPDDPFVIECGLQESDQYHFVGVMICFFR